MELLCFGGAPCPLKRFLAFRVCVKSGLSPWVMGASVISHAVMGECDLLYGVIRHRKKWPRAFVAWPPAGAWRQGLKP